MLGVFQVGVWGFRQGRAWMAASAEGWFRAASTALDRTFEVDAVWVSVEFGLCPARRLHRSDSLAFPGQNLAEVRALPVSRQRFGVR
jgi:hypothetical protein